METQESDHKTTLKRRGTAHSISQLAVNLEISKHTIKIQEKFSDPNLQFIYSNQWIGKSPIANYG